MSFNSLRTLRQSEMTFSEFEAKARRLIQECQYPVGGDRLLQDIIVTEAKSMTAYRKAVDKGSSPAQFQSKQTYMLLEYKYTPSRNASANRH